MAGKSNPFAAKVAKKQKLKAFGSKRKGGTSKKTSPPKPVPVTTSAKPNPFQRKKQRKIDIAKEEEFIASLMSTYEEAFAEEERIFARWQKQKPDTIVYRATENKWKAAMQEVERTQQKLLAATTRLRKLKETT